MSENLEPVLREIADLLRQRVELQQQQEARLERGLNKLQERTRPDFEEMQKKSEERREAIQQQAEQDRQERREFQARLLSELERQNNLLERILERLAQ